MEKKKNHPHSVNIIENIYSEVDQSKKDTTKKTPTRRPIKSIDDIPPRKSH